MIVTRRGDDHDAAPATTAEVAAPPDAEAACPHASEASLLERLRLGAAGPIDVDLLRTRRPMPAVTHRLHPATWRPASQRDAAASELPATCDGCAMPLAAGSRFCRRCGTFRAIQGAAAAS